MFGFKNNQLLLNVIIVGAGGTGGRLIPLIGQKLSQGNYKGLNPRITIVDGDVVEEKNLTRQNFISIDVGRNKAEVLAERYGDAFDIPVVAVPRMAEGNLMHTIQRCLTERGVDSRTIQLITRRPAATVIFFCVDNMKIRYEILANMTNSYHGTDSPIIIDAGNENTFGQVSVFHGSRGYIDRAALEGVRGKICADAKNPPMLPYIPCPLDFYEANQDFKGVSDLSCAEQEQTGAVNMMMAALQFSIFQTLYDHHLMTVGTWRADIHNGNSQDKFTAEWLSQFTGMNDSWGLVVQGEITSGKLIDNPLL